MSSSTGSAGSWGRRDRRTGRLGDGEAMTGILALAAENLISPMVLFFALGVAASLARSDLVIPEAVARGLAIYLMMAIGFKGGAGVAAHGVDARLAAVLIAGAFLSAAIPLVAFALLRFMTRLSAVDAAAVAAHYGSISIVTFVAATQALTLRAIPYEGFLVATAAIMETPAILTALWLAGRYGGRTSYDSGFWREIALNGSVVVLIGSFLIGWATGEPGLDQMAPFLVDPFNGILALFLLDMGLVAGRGLRTGGKELPGSAIAFALVMPPIGAALGALVAWPLGLSPGGLALFMTLSGSASYIAVPAAMRVALPEARASIYLTLSLGVTFPFNLVLGIPLYIAAAGWHTG
jgi:uncharacterized protein